MANLVTVEAEALLDATSGQATYTAPTAPVQVALVIVTGTATAAGTEVTGGSYARATVTFNAATSSGISSNVALTYTNMPAETSITGVDEWDSAATKVRRWFGNLAAAKSTNAGDTFSIASGSYSKTLS